MKKSDLYEIAIKILGIYLFVSAIDLLRDVLTNFAVLEQTKQKPEAYNNFNQLPFLVLSIANFVFIVSFAYFLTFKTKAITKLVCIATDYQETASLFAERKVVYEITLMILGLILVIWSLPDFAYKLKTHIQMVQNDVPLKDYDTGFLWLSGIKIFIGILSALSARPLAELLGRETKQDTYK